MSSAFVGPFDGSDVQSLSAELAFLLAMRENISCNLHSVYKMMRGGKFLLDVKF
jgi:hypothetical protein